MCSGLSDTGTKEMARRGSGQRSHRLFGGEGSGPLLTRGVVLGAAERPDALVANPKNDLKIYKIYKTIDAIRA